jgi:pheromone shutdown protein TraB
MLDFLRFIDELIGKLSGFELMLLIVLAGYALMIRVAQKNKVNPFDYAEFFRNDAGKLSMGAKIGFMCFIVASWALLYATMNVIKNHDDIDALFKWYAMFIGVFSGTQVIIVFLNMLPILLALWKGVTPPQYKPPKVVKVD